MTTAITPHVPGHTALQLLAARLVDTDALPIPPKFFQTAGSVTDVAAANWQNLWG